MAPSRPPRPPTHPTRDPKELLKKRGADLIRKVSDKDRYAIFLEPVDIRQVQGYTDLIARPMDLSTLQKNLQMGVYRTPMEFRADLDLIWSNCCIFNADDSIYYKEAVRLRVLCERYYDELCRLLSRDGVAAALGLTKVRRAGPYSRNSSKRPPRHRMQNGTGPSSGGVSSSLQTSEPTSPEPDADVSGSASASGSVSGAQPTFRDSQIRRARTAAEAAIAAAASAEEEFRTAAKAAGVAPNVSSDRQIFSGPNDILHKSSRDIHALRARRLKVANHRKMKNRCAEVPEAWRRIGRWHSRGVTMPKFATTERALNVRYGQMYQRYIHKSAPIARRLLATLLDEHVVSEHDLKTTRAQNRSGPVLDRVLVNGSPNHNELEKMDISPKVIKKNLSATIPANGIHDSTDIDNGRVTRKPSKSSQQAAKRARRRNSPTQVNGGADVPLDLPRPELNEMVEHHQDTVEMTWKDSGATTRSPHPGAKQISDLHMTLKENGIDPSFLSSLVRDGACRERDVRSGQTEQDQCKGSEAARNDDMEYLLTMNHATMMNVLRLRALRESADEADCEDLEDRERELLERLAKDMSSVIKKLPPSSVVHPADAADTATALALSTQVLSQGQK